VLYDQREAGAAELAFSQVLVTVAARPEGRAAVVQMDEPYRI